MQGLQACTAKTGFICLVKLLKTSAFRENSHIGGLLLSTPASSAGLQEFREQWEWVALDVLQKKVPLGRLQVKLQWEPWRQGRRGEGAVKPSIPDSLTCSRDARTHTWPVEGSRRWPSRALHRHMASSLSVDFVSPAFLCPKSFCQNCPIESLPEQRRQDPLFLYAGQGHSFPSVQFLPLLLHVQCLKSFSLCY